MTSGSMAAPNTITSNNEDTAVDCSMAWPSEQKKSGRRLTSAKKQHTQYSSVSNSEFSLNISTRQTSYCAEECLRKVSFAEKVTLKIFNRIPKVYAYDIWYTANDMDNFRTKVLNCKQQQLKVKLKSARCHNHMRRVLLEYRINRAQKGNNTITSCVNARNPRDLSIVAMSSSRKPREVAMKNAKKLEKEIIANQSLQSSTISSDCFGPRHHRAFDYYLGYLIDSLCVVI